MKTFKSFLAVIIIAIFSQAPAIAQELDVIYVPTREPVLDAMLRMANVDALDIVYDLGCGDGRIVIAAAKQFGANGVGIDIDPQRIKEARENAAEANVSDKVKFIEGDLFKSDFSEATVVTLYLLTQLNERLKPMLMEQLKPGTRVVSHAFSMGDWEPDQTEEVDGTTVYLWTVPEKN
ncbi:hypothetical protein BH23BAC2_BH23BAC2_06730 [soil metagenome]